MTRTQNRSNRLDDGYWFQGNDDYIFVPLYRQGCSDNKTKTIGFVVTDDGQYIEVVYKNIVNASDDEINFHNKLVEYLNSLNYFNVERKGDKQYFFWFKSDDLKKNLYFYIDTIRREANALLEMYNLKSKYIITEDKFQQNIHKIEEVEHKKNNLGSNQSPAGHGNGYIEYKIKNIILYGVPGVGKTHNVNKLIRLIEERKSADEIFSEVQSNERSGDELSEGLKDRTEFVTFHQSFGYEDFIEGFRPDEDGNIRLVDGVFKRLAQKAERNLRDSMKENSFDIETFIQDYSNHIEESNQTELEPGLTIEVKRNSEGEPQSFVVGGKIVDQSLTKAVIVRDFEDFLNGRIKSYSDIKPSYKSQSKYHGNASNYFKLFQDMKKFLDSQGREKYFSASQPLQNYYLVIDEINRGNISKIFGELITLIEEDKRDNYEVTLPYSKEPFRVPSNLYIIGTMNSTDKSIALIDAALRRRFTFVKMEPNLDLIEDPNAKKLFIALNGYLKERLGEDYQIGHSDFMKVQSASDLDFIVEYKIKPLLEEYFYGDRDGLDGALTILNTRQDIGSSVVTE